MESVRNKLACPKCKGALRQIQENRIVCACGKIFMFDDGIVDLRYSSSELNDLFSDDAMRAAILAEAQNNVSIAELVRLCYELPESRNREALDKTTEFMLEGRGRMKQLLQRFSVLLSDAGWKMPSDGYALELGCGCGLTTGELLSHFDTVCGINPAQDEMVVARRINRDQFDNQLVLIRAFGEHLPFAVNTFDFIIATDVIEHVNSPLSVLQEIQRVLKPGGICVMNSPNKYNIRYPDGHVHLKYMGFIPDLLREPYVRWRCQGASWRKRNVRLLSYRCLKASLKKLNQCKYYIGEEHPSCPSHNSLVNALYRSSIYGWLKVTFGSEHSFMLKKTYC